MCVIDFEISEYHFYVHYGYKILILVGTSEVKSVDLVYMECHLCQTKNDAGIYTSCWYRK